MRQKLDVPWKRRNLFRNPLTATLAGFGVSGWWFVAKLKSVQPRLQPAGNRLLPAMTREEAEAQRFKQRDQSVKWRSWYKTERWRKLRLEILQRDHYTCQVTGDVCVGRYPAPTSAVVDHVKPHRGDERLFWDPENLQTVTKEYHDKVKQSEERRTLGW